MITYFADGTDLRQAKGAWRVSLGTAMRGVAGRQSTSKDSYRRHGTGPTAGPWSAAKKRLVCQVTDRNPNTGVSGGSAQLRLNEDTLKGLLLRPDRPVVLAESMTGILADSRTTRIEVTDEVDIESDEKTFSQFTLTANAIDAFWRDYAATTATAATLTSLRGGTAPITDAQFLIPGSGAATYRVTDGTTGRWIQWSGETVASGSYVRIDAARETAYVATSAAWTGGTEKPGRVRVGAGGFEVHPAVSLSMPANTQIQARRAYL